MSDDRCNVPAPPTSPVYFPDEIILYGVKLNKTTDYATLHAGIGNLRIQLYKSKVAKSDEYSVVAAYGYSFEGQCYRFDNIRLFVVVAGPQDLNANGCGFDKESYSMWRIRAGTELLELTTTFNDAQTLILDANLPGKKAPNTYAIAMAMAHRNSRIS